MNKLKSVYIIFIWLIMIVDIINSVIHCFSHEYIAAIYWLLWSFFLYKILLRIFLYKIAFRITEESDD